MYIKTIKILVVLCFCNGVAAQDANPLLDMVGKPYSEYHDTYVHLMDSLFWGDSQGRRAVVRLFEEAAAADVTGEWDLICRIIKCDARFYESRDGGLIASADYTATDFADDQLALANEANVKGFPLIRILSLWYVAQTYHLFVHDYERAFTFFAELAAELETRTTKEFPLRLYCYLEIANLYFTFREYGDAAVYYGKMADDPEAATNNYKPLYSALHGLGGCYRYMDDFVKSDSCYRRLLALVASDEDNNYLWGGIAACDIGYNFYLQGDDDTALEWLVPAIETITRENDAAYVSLRATTIAEIYLKKSRPLQAKQYIDMALDFHERSRVPDKKSGLYYLLGRYYVFIGDKVKANACLDSAMTAVNREKDDFSGLALRRVEQRLRAADRTIHEQRLNEEKTLNRTYRRTVVLISVSLVIILAMFCLLLVYARNKRDAYRSLVIKVRQWAQTPYIQARDDTVIANRRKRENIPIANRREQDNDSGNEVAPAAEAGTDPTEYDRLLFDRLNRFVVEQQIHLNSDATLEQVATLMNINRTYISHAVNRCTGSGFSAFINELRIKEAVRLMSGDRLKNLTMEGIAREAGFNKRSTFYRAFKKTTGFSPMDYLGNSG